MKKEICKLFKDLIKIEPEIRDQRPCHDPEVMRKQSPYNVVKHNPYKFLKQVYRKLNIHEKKQFIQALYMRLQDKGLQKIQEMEIKEKENNNGN